MSRRRLASRVFGSIALVAVAAFILAACGSSDGDGSNGDTEGGAATAESTSGSTDEATNTEPVDIAFFGLAAENAYTQFMYKAATRKAEEMGGTLEFFDGKFDGATQVAQVQDAITSGRFQGFIVMPNDQPGIVPVVEQALADGIKVAALQFPIGSDPVEAKPQVEGVTTSVIEDVVRGAEVTAEGINEMCKGIDPCKAGILWGARTVSWEAAKEKPLEETIEPNVQIVAQADGGFLQGPSEKAAAAMLQANPDMNVMASPSGDQMILGGQRAVEAAGKEIGLADRPNDAIALVGYGASKAGVERVESEDWFQTYALVPETMAEVCTELLIDELHGEEIPEEKRGIVQTEISPIGDNITLEVLKENPDFVAQWEG